MPYPVCAALLPLLAVAACRKMDYQHTPAFRAMIQHLAPDAASIAADELPSLLWAASTLACETPAGKAATAGPSSSSSTSSSRATSSSSSSSSLRKVPQNDGVIGAVNSSRIAELPEVVEFMLGASQVLSGGFEREKGLVAMQQSTLPETRPPLQQVHSGGVRMMVHLQVASAAPAQGG